MAALDTDWSSFTPAQRAAFGFARKLTYEPHLLAHADIEQLRKHYTDLQILEMTLSIAGNNSINRWKEGIGVMQEREGSRFQRGDQPPADPAQTSRLKSFLTPTSDKYKDRVSIVAVLHKDEKTGEVCRATVCQRPKLLPREETEKALEAARKRKPRLPLVDVSKARDVLGEDAPAETLPQWMLLLANFPRDGKSKISGIRSAEEKGDLKPLLKAQVSWIVARQDNAWYAVAEAQARLKKLGWSDDQIYKLDGDWKEFSKSERALFTVARNLAASPIVLTDEEVTNAVKLASPRDVVQLISYVTNRASFDRITETAGLQVDR